MCPTFTGFHFCSLCVFSFFICCPSLSGCLSPPLLSGILCSAISILRCLLFFSCNQTHRFISVALRHHLNQFPSTLPSWRAAVRAGTLQLGTHLYSHTHTHTFSLSFTFTHTVTKAQKQAHITLTRIHNAHTLIPVIQHITVL